MRVHNIKCSGIKAQVHSTRDSLAFPIVRLKRSVVRTLVRQLLLSVVVLFIAVLPVNARGERPAFPKLLPAETFLMVRLDNAANFREALNNAAVGKLLADPQMAPFVEQLIGDFGLWVAEQGQEFGLQLGELAAIPQGEVALALIDRDAGKAGDDKAKNNNSNQNEAEGEGRRRRGPPIDLLLVIEAKERMAYLRGLIEQAEIRAGQNAQMREVKGPGNVKIHAWSGNGEQEFGWTEREGTMVFCTGLRSLERYLEAWDKGEQADSLASEPAFASALTPCLGSDEKQPQLTFFFDPIRLIRAGGRGNTSAQITLQLLEQFGLGNIRGIGATALVGAKDYDSLLHAHLVLEGPRTGILGVIQPKTGDLKPEKWVPQDVSAFSGLRWDVPATVNGIERVLEKIAGSTFWETSVEKRVLDRYGVDLQKDVFEQFGGRFTMLQWHEPPARLGSQVMLFAAEMKDLETAEKTLQLVLEKRNVTEPRETYAGARLYPIRTLRPREDQLIRVGKPT